MKTVNKFNTKLAQELSNQTTLSSFEILKVVDSFVKDESNNNINSALILQDAVAIIDERARNGAYQVFTGGPYVTLFVNGNKLRMLQLPFGKVVFNIEKKGGWSKTTSSLNSLMAFIYSVVTDEDNAHAFNSTVVEA